MCTIFTGKKKKQKQFFENKNIRREKTHRKVDVDKPPGKWVTVMCHSKMTSVSRSLQRGKMGNRLQRWVRMIVINGVLIIVPINCLVKLVTGVITLVNGVIL